MNLKPLDKIALIYEYNPDSPLFVRVAANLYSEGNFEKAVEIIKKGLENYPNYPTALLISAKIKAALGKSDEAKTDLKKVESLLNENSFYEYHLEEISKIERRNSVITQSKIASKKSELEDHLEELAEKLKNAKIESVDAEHKEPQPFSKSNSFKELEIISDTLAEIYFVQGNFIESKNVYQKLIDRFPSKETHYKSKIEEIENKIKSHSGS